MQLPVFKLDCNVVALSKLERDTPFCQKTSFIMNHGSGHTARRKTRLM